MPGPFTAMIAITITPAAYKALKVMRPETEDAPAGAEIRIWLELTGPHSDHEGLNLRCDLACRCPSRIKLLPAASACGYVGNAFALSKRSGISTALAAASILSMPARHTAIGIWLFIAWCGRRKL